MIPKASELNRGALSRWSLLMGLMFLAFTAAPRTIIAMEGGVSHTIPGANATLVDLPPVAPGWFIKPMYLHYSGSASARVPIPTAAGVVGNLHATVNTFALGGGYTFEQTILGGAHYTLAAFLPYTWVDASANVVTPLGAVRKHNSVSGFGDLTVVPMMLAWKIGDWQLDTLVPIYAPIGSYEKGRLGNTGLNYWTFDPMAGVSYLNKKIGFNAMLHFGYAMNTENPDTNYRSGSLLHFDAAVQQVLPVGPGFLTIGVEGFYFKQITGDSGSGATLGDFKGMTAGVGPVLGYVLPIGKKSLALEVKWLAEIDTKKRLEGDYIWAKIVFKF